MTWLRLDDKFAGHPKITPLSDGAFRLHVCGLCYCASHETDGLIPLEQVPLLMPHYRKAHLTALYSRGLWLPHRELVEIHDFTDYNPTHAQQQERRRRNADKLRKWREAHPNE